MASIVTNRGKWWLAKNDWTSGSFVIRAMVMTSSYTPSVDHNFVSDVTNEITNANYARRTVSNRTLTEDDTNDRVKVDADDITPFTALGAGDLPKYVGIYVQTGGSDASPSDDDLLMVLDLGSAPAPNGGDYSMPFHADGLCYVG
jgi:hypothetical protein